MRISDWSSDVCSSDLDDDRAARSAHPSLRHRRDRQRQLAVQEPKLSAVAAGAGAGANEDVVLVDVERVVPFYVPIPVPVPAPIDTLSGIWGYRLFWGQAKNTPKSTPKIGRAHVSTPVTNAQLVC